MPLKMEGLGGGRGGGGGGFELSFSGRVNSSKKLLS